MKETAEEEIERQIYEVTIDLDVSKVGMTVSASTGKTIIVITGKAFHNGINKNNWELGSEAGQSVAEQLKGADLTLNHPRADSIGFTRNMDGGVNEAVVGIVTKASFEETENGWEVSYEAEVHRSELFEALESGLWLRPEYGVSIGGYGIPSEFNEETGYAMFSSDFTLDHLAIVHRPAYTEATIDSATRVEVDELAIAKEEKVTLKYGSAPVMANEVPTMTEDPTENKPSNEELEALQAELILSKATIEQFRAKEAAKTESERTSLVEDATALGLNGHEDLSADVIKNLIASWVSANPEPEVIEMKPVETASEIVVETAETIIPETNEVYVANYFNGSHLKTAEDIYARAFDSWVAAYNRGLGAADDRAKQYNELDQAQRELLNFTEEI